MARGPTSTKLCGMAHVTTRARPGIPTQAALAAVTVRGAHAYPGDRHAMPVVAPSRRPPNTSWIDASHNLATIVGW